MKRRVVIAIVFMIAVLAWLCWLEYNLPPEPLEIVELWGY